MPECIRHSLLNIKDMHNKLFFLLATLISMPLFAQTSKDIEPAPIKCQYQVVQQKDTIQHNKISEGRETFFKQLQKFWKNKNKGALMEASTGIKLGLSDLPTQAPNCDMLEKH